MANFNPNVPDTNDPNYMGYSEPIKQPELKSTLSTAFKGAGDILSDVFKGADEVVKAFAQKTVQDVIEPARQEFTDALNAKDGLSRLGSLLSGQPQEAASDPLNLNPDTTNLPSDVKALPNKLSVLEGARANGNLSETGYYGRLTAMVKDIRSRYPTGYSDYIDEQVSKVTGVNPANAYIKSIIGDINSFNENANKPKNMVLEKLAAHINTPGVAELWVGVNHGQMSPDSAMLNLNKILIPQFQTEVATKNLELKAKQGEDVSKDVADVATRMLAPVGNAYFDKIKIGMESFGTKTTDKGDIIFDDPKQLAQMRSDIAQASTLYTQQANQIFDTPRPDLGGRSYRSVLNQQSPGKVDELIKQGRSMLDFSQDKLTNEKNGLIWQARDLNKAQEENDAWNVKNDPDIGGQMRLLTVLSKVGSDEASRAYFLKALGGDFPKQIAARADLGMLKILAPNDPTKVQPMQQAIDNMRKDLKDTVVPPKTYDALLQNTANFIKSDGDPKNRLNMLYSIIGKDNYGMLTNDKIARDYTTSDGRRVKGAYSIAARFMDDDFIKSVNDLNGKFPGVKDDYMNWVDQATTKELLGPDIDRLKGYSKDPNDGWSIVYSTEKHGFRIEERGSTGDPMVDAARANSKRLMGGKTVPDLVKTTIDNLNTVTSGLSNIAKSGMGGNAVDPDTYILQTLMNTPHNVDFNNMKGIPNEIMTAISTALSKQKAEEAAAKEQDAKIKSKRVK